MRAPTIRIGRIYFYATIRRRISVSVGKSYGWHYRLEFRLSKSPPRSNVRRWRFWPFILIEVIRRNITTSNNLNGRTWYIQLMARGKLNG